MTRWEAAKSICRWTLWGLVVVAISSVVGGLWAALLVRVFFFVMGIEF